MPRLVAAVISVVVLGSLAGCSNDAEFITGRGSLAAGFFPGATDSELDEVG